MSVAALFDIHGNLPALEAVLQEVTEAGATQVVIGGDIMPGALPGECLQRLEALEVPLQFIHGNGDLAVLAQMRAPEPSAATYWGTTSGEPLPPELQEAVRWNAKKLDPRYEAAIASWPRTAWLEIEGLGRVLFCHATPRSEVEIFTRRTEESRLRPLFDPLNADVVVCGHTHMPFDRRVGTTRVLNSGSVGMPIGRSGAFWTLLGPGVELRRTEYDLAAAAQRIRASGYPMAEQNARDLLTPPDEEKFLALYESASLTFGK